jgi:signal transduction histidine kinase/ActR/RegA family two-component response regulator
MRHWCNARNVVMLVFLTLALWALAGPSLAQPASSPISQDASWLHRIFNSDYTPRQICMHNEADVVWMHLLSDAIIAAAYYSIPIALLYFVRRRKDVVFGFIFYCFASFILLCGTTHVFSVIAIWNPYYRLDGIIKVFTAGVSIMTAVLLWQLIPQALAMPSLAQLRETNQRLHDEMAERTRAEAELRTLTAQLETRVQERTQALHAQVEHLGLLHQITRGIGERQDLQSILHIVLRNLEDNLPLDFSCVCLYDQAANLLTVVRVGGKSAPIAAQLSLSEQSLIPIDQDGLSRCVRGQLVYQPDIAQTQFPFSHRLAIAGLRSLVLAPLLVESKVFGVLVAARRQPESFDTGERDFLKQLSEHVALASHQSQIYSALQQAYDDLRQTQQAVMQQERLRSLGQMASGIAHDINNAISPVSLYTESLLETEPNLSDRGRRYLQTIDHAIDDVAQTVARLREFYRQREPQLALTSVNLNLLVQQVIDLTRARWSGMPQQRGIVIKMITDLTPDLTHIRGVESEIREALTNLIFNAVDAMPEGGTLTLRTKTAHAAPAAPDAPPIPQAYVEVADTGVGMDEETRLRCMEPFFTTKGERGTGLGLAMVYGMAKRHSADILIQSAPAQGTTVRLAFDIPATPIIDATPPSRLQSMPSRLRILVIDDDPLITESLRDTLQTDGHAVVTTNGGQAGIQAFREAHKSPYPFAVVITDLGMPYIDGRQVASSIKAASPDTPVILLTGWGQRLMTEGDIPSHVDRVLNKPPKLHELRTALSQLTT